MPKRLVLSSLSLSLVAAFGAGQVWALGFGRAQPSVTMGAPLDFAVGVRLDSGELLTDDCVAAEVWIGDNAVPRLGVGASLETAGGAPAIRVRTLSRIDEPIVTINISAGCDTKMTRRFTLFADPPGLSPTLPAVVAPEPVHATTPTPARLAPADPRPAAVPAAREAAASPRGARVERTAPRSTATRSTAPRPAPAGAVVPVDTLRLGKPTRSVAADGSGARLRLDAPSITYAADQAAAEAAERRATELAAVRAAIDVAQSAASSATTRVAAMEASLEALKKDSRANRETMLKLQAALADADTRGRWTPWLLAGVLALLGVAGWLYARLRRSESERQQAWWNSAQSVESPGTGERALAPAVVEAAPVEVAQPSQASQPAAPAPEVDPPSPPTQTTQPIPAGLVVPDAPLRDVSIEELLDVEQQAEFFVVLGQDEAAIDLLVGHLRSSGGVSPLPYLKLLEIYHRRGEQGSYERMRRRFGDRFDAEAPEWSAGLQSGRSLEDYPVVMAQVQRRWGRPADAMADLEALLFRTGGGDLLDLPAYRDVLFLFTLARDLQEMAQHEAAEVDVLLPLGPESNHGADRPTPADSRSMEPGDRPTAPPRATTQPAPLAERSSVFVGGLGRDSRKAT